MTLHYEDATVTLHHGDCLDVLRALPDASVDAVVTDPPYGLEFMGKEWDSFKPKEKPCVTRRETAPTTPATGVGGANNAASTTAKSAGPAATSGDRARSASATIVEADQIGGFQDGSGGNAYSRSRVRTDTRRHGGDMLTANTGFQAWCELWTAECLRVLKPGGHLLAFGGSRTYHRLTCAVEDSGFEIRDCITWHFGSGFPKSLNVTDALDRIVPPDAHCACGPRSMQTPPGSRVGYPSSHGSGGEPPLSAAGDDPAPVPSLADARARSHDDPPAGDPVAGPASSVPGEASAHPSIGDSIHPAALRSEADQPSASALSDTETSTSTAPGRAPHRTVDRTQHTSGLAAGSASASSWRNKYMACQTCGGFVSPPGLGTALKPATEFIVVARKPLIGTVAANVLAHGTGALNVDGCRVGFASAADEAESKGKNQHADFGTEAGGNAVYGDYSMVPRQNYNPPGRWPANVILDESQARELDLMSGERPGAVSNGSKTAEGLNGSDTFKIHEREQTPGRGDFGGASRFMYVAKADASERVRVNGTAHPTVKPLTLMRWLVRLVCPPGGTILEPFAGSGTTVEACILEGFQCIAIEREADYLPLIVQRINRRRDPVAAVLAQGDDAGLFDLLGGEGA